MTIDKEKLKALAEAMLRDEQGAELSGEEVRDFPEAVRSYEAMTAQSAVLALLAEIDRLTTSRSKKERELEQELEVWRHGPSCWSCGDTGDVHDITGGVARRMRLPIRPAHQRQSRARPAQGRERRAQAERVLQRPDHRDA
ncbi:hypothetical protein M0766_06645 [Pseudomonas putida]|nr:hypothetical protein M0766_06645 [Pseudomonas putida]